MRVLEQASVALKELAVIGGCISSTNDGENPTWGAIISLVIVIEARRLPSPE